jgi:hypothetical protein
MTGAVWVQGAICVNVLILRTKNTILKCGKFRTYFDIIYKE